MNENREHFFFPLQSTPGKMTETRSTCRSSNISFHILWNFGAPELCQSLAMVNTGYVNMVIWHFNFFFNFDLILINI